MSWQSTGMRLWRFFAMAFYFSFDGCDNQWISGFQIGDMHEL